ncbi:MAG: FmdB family zinc ribbon protein [Candidatus Nanopelagicales bacterium]
MPTYQYACNDCGHELEAVQSFSDDALTTCPQCGGRLRKLFGNVGVVFKGSGFYRTDSRSSSSDTAASGTSTSSSTSDTTKSTTASSTKSESATSSSPSGSSGATSAS